VLFDKIASVYLKNIYLYFGIGNGQPRKPALCQLYRHIFVPYLSWDAEARVATAAGKSHQVPGTTVIYVLIAVKWRHVEATCIEARAQHKLS